MTTAATAGAVPRPRRRWLAPLLVLGALLLAAALLASLLPGWLEPLRHGVHLTVDGETVELAGFDGVDLVGGVFGTVIGLFVAAVVLLVVVPVAIGLALLGVVLALAAVLVPLALVLALLLSPLLVLAWLAWLVVS